VTGKSWGFGVPDSRSSLHARARARARAREASRWVTSVSRSRGSSELPGASWHHLSTQDVALIVSLCLHLPTWDVLGSKQFSVGR
jgi:hypothetical protein